jgi:hypothetical protein
LAIGMTADAFGAKRSMLFGLGVLGLASAMGSMASSVAGLMLWRASSKALVFVCGVACPRADSSACEGHAIAQVARLLVLICRRVQRSLCYWGHCSCPVGWRSWWLVVHMAVMVHGLGGEWSLQTEFQRLLPFIGNNACVKHSVHRALGGSRCVLACILGSGWPWWVSCRPSTHKLVVRRYLGAALTAFAASVNILGNVMSGRLLEEAFILACCWL